MAEPDVERGALIAIPCNGCGAALPLDLERQGGECPHCGASHRLEHAQVQRAREHLARLEALEEQASYHRGEAEFYQRSRRPVRGFIAAIALNLLMVGGGWAWYLAREWLSGPLGRILANVLMVPLAVIGLIAVMIGWVVFLSRRRRPDYRLPAQPIGTAACSQCGATVSVVLGATMHCPFCEAELLPDAASARRAEQVGQAHVRELSRQEQREREGYMDYIQRSSRWGSWIARVWAGICIGSLAGMFVVAGGWALLTGERDLRAEVVLVGAGLGVAGGIVIALWLGRRRR